MFEGFLGIGGAEVLNSARAVGYTTTHTPPINWLQCPPCEGVRVFLGDDEYTYANIADAPWYDAEDETTHRFLGAHALTVEGLPDSTRAAETAESILDGGVVGRVRKASRRMRVRAILTAHGEDALESGFNWLSSALSPDSCGTHGDSCGAADMEFFTACPPTPAEVTTPQPVWNDPLTNRATNPSFEGTGSIPAGFSRVSTWAASGTWSLQNAAAGTYPTVATLAIQTLLITPRNDGQILRFGGVDTVTTALTPVRVFGSGAVALGQGWWDDLLIIDGSYGGAYFDGSSPDSTEAEMATLGADVVESSWTGTADASTSTQRTGSVVAVEDPALYLDTIDRLSRHLHTVTCVAGPTVEEKLHRGDTWGYVVEFVLVAGVPWMFGSTKPVTLEPSLPVIVQDVPFNLVPYPSAELASGTVVASTNLVTNPSVEAATTGWTVAIGGGMPQTTVLTQSNELAAAGGYSAKAACTVTGSGSGGALALDLPITLPAVPAGTRYSANLWASASVQSGTAVLGVLDYFAMWQTAAGAALRTDSIGSGAATGGAKSLKSMLPPAGAGKVLLRAHLTVTSYTSGAVIRLYADAAALTIP